MRAEFPSVAVDVLHAFQKKSPRGNRTARTDVELIARRLKVARQEYEASKFEGVNYEKFQRGRKLVKVAGPKLSQKRVPVEALDEITAVVRRYILVQLLLSVVVGAATWLVSASVRR